MGEPETADEEITGQVRILTVQELNSHLFDCGIVLKDGRWVDFYRISKRGPLNPLYVELFKAMTDKKMQILKQALADGTLSPQQMFIMFTSGVPAPNDFFPKRIML